MQISVFRKVVYAFCGLILAVGFSACGGSFGDDSRSEIQRDRAKLETRYRKVQGTYVGSIESLDGTSATNVELSMYIDYKDDGVDPEGNPKFLPLLLARFLLPDVIGENDRERLIADYDDLTGQIIFTRHAAASGASAQAAASTPFSITGVVRDDGVEGQVVRTGGVWGRIQAKRVSAVAQAADDGEDEDERRRRRKIYARIEGVYRGTVDNSVRPYQGQLTITITQTLLPGPSGKQIQMPILAAKFSRLDVPDPISESWPMSNVAYSPQVGLVNMSSSEADANRGSSVPNGRQLSVDGKITDGTADVDLTGNPYLSGRFRGTKIVN